MAAFGAAALAGSHRFLGDFGGPQFRRVDPRGIAVTAHWRKVRAGTWYTHEKADQQRRACRYGPRACPSLDAGRAEVRDDGSRPERNHQGSERKSDHRPGLSRSSRRHAGDGALMARRAFARSRSEMEDRESPSSILYLRSSKLR